MSNHNIHYTVDSRGKHFATCRDRPGSNPHWRSEFHDTRQEVEDEVRVHEHDVQVSRASLGNRTPSMCDQRDHYRRMEADPHVSEMDRKMWGRLADEMDRRLGTDQPDPDPLF